MARRSTPPEPQHAQLTPERMRLGIRRLEGVISEVESFDPTSVTEHDVMVTTSALGTSVQGALEQTFGHGTVEICRYSAATTFAWPINYARPTPLHQIQQALKRCRETSLALLHNAVSFLRQELELSAEGGEPAEAPSTLMPQARKVFVVHGHDEAALQTVARFLEQLGLEPIILSEQPDAGRTIIEKFEAYAS